MTIERRPSRLGLQALLALCICLSTTVAAFGQAGPAFRLRAVISGHPSVAIDTPQYLSASGAVALGFTPSPGAGTSTVTDPCAMLPPDSRIPKTVGVLVERMLRASPTFRRQWVRLAAARVRLHVTLDHERIVDGSSARSLIDGQSLHVRMQLRGADRRLPEHLAHEIEHVLEHLDGVDLAEAAARGVRGVTHAGRSAFETRRARVIGRRVAAEVRRFDAGS